MADSAKKIRWYEPRWSYVKKLWGTLPRFILNAKSLSRIAIVTVVVSAVILVGLRLAFPLIVLPNLWRAALAFPASILVLVFQLALLTAIKPGIVIHKQKLIYQHGESTRIIDFDQIDRVSLTVHRENRVRLRVLYRVKEDKRSLCVGIPSDVDLLPICDALPIPPIVRDARGIGDSKCQQELPSVPSVHAPC